MIQELFFSPPCVDIHTTTLALRETRKTQLCKKDCLNFLFLNNTHWFIYKILCFSFSLPLQPVCRHTHNVWCIYSHADVPQSFIDIRKILFFFPLVHGPHAMMITEQSPVKNFHKYNTHIKTPLNFFSVVWSIKWEKLQQARSAATKKRVQQLKIFQWVIITSLLYIHFLPFRPFHFSRVVLCLHSHELVSRPHSLAVSSTCCKEIYTLLFCVFDDDRHCRVENIIKLIENIFRYISVAKVARSLDTSLIFFFDLIRVGVREKKRKEKYVLLCRAQNLNEKRRTKADPSLFYNLCNYHQHI